MQSIATDTVGAKARPGGMMMSVRAYAAQGPRVYSGDHTFSLLVCNGEADWIKPPMGWPTATGITIVVEIIVSAGLFFGSHALSLE